MEFTEVKKDPEFELKLNLDEAIALWKIVWSAQKDGNVTATMFVDALYDFAENSNRY